jgi:hypothetical protein
LKAGAKSVYKIEKKGKNEMVEGAKLYQFILMLIQLIQSALVFM